MYRLKSEQSPEYRTGVKVYVYVQSSVMLVSRSPVVFQREPFLGQ